MGAGRRLPAAGADHTPATQAVARGYPAQLRPHRLGLLVAQPRYRLAHLEPGHGRSAHRRRRPLSLCPAASGTHTKVPCRAPAGQGRAFAARRRFSLRSDGRSPSPAPCRRAFHAFRGTGAPGQGHPAGPALRGTLPAGDAHRKSLQCRQPFPQSGPFRAAPARGRSGGDVHRLAGGPSASGPLSLASQYRPHPAGGLSCGPGLSLAGQCAAFAAAGGRDAPVAGHGHGPGPPALHAAAPDAPGAPPFQRAGCPVLHAALHHRHLPPVRLRYRSATFRPVRVRHLLRHAAYGAAVAPYPADVPRAAPAPFTGQHFAGLLLHPAGPAAPFPAAVQQQRAVVPAQCFLAARPGHPCPAGGLPGTGAQPVRA